MLRTSVLSFCWLLLALEAERLQPRLTSSDRDSFGSLQKVKGRAEKTAGHAGGKVDRVKGRKHFAAP